MQKTILECTATGTTALFNSVDDCDSACENYYGCGETYTVREYAKTFVTRETFSLAMKRLLTHGSID